jgi:glycosyltransferase involved in cell wall biosynthesis
VVATPRFAVIITHNRPGPLAQCVEAVLAQADEVVVLDNASDPPVTLDLAGVEVIHVPDQPPNLSALWNLGLGWCERRVLGWGLEDDEPWYVALLCDDAIVPPGWFGTVTSAMRDTGAVAGCSDPWGRDHEPRLKTTPDSDLAGRMVGWAFVLDGSIGLGADERFYWWWCDTDLDFRARQVGGMVMVGGYPVPNLHPNDFTSARLELAEQAGRDGETFAQKWGYRPW